MACCPSELPPDQVRPLVLVIEDEPGVPELLGTALRSRGLEVAHGTGRPERVAKTASSEPDLLLIEVSLRTGQGFRVLEHLRGHVTLAQLPVVVYSSQPLDGHDRGRLRLGRTEFLTKRDVSFQELEQRLLVLLATQP